MPRFRLCYSSGLASATVIDVIAEVLRPGHFFVGPGLALAWEAPADEVVRWEVFRGRLVDAALTRQERSFRAWNVFLQDDTGRSAEPLLSVKLGAGEIHVVRAIYCYAWEGYDAGGNVIQSRETRKWVRELVGTIRLEEMASADELRDELVCKLFQAVVGTSRLPLTSVEAPLPAFSLGALAYCYRTGLGAAAAGRPMTTCGELARCNREAGLAPVERAKLLEALLRATPTEALASAAEDFFGEAGTADEPPIRVLDTLFNEVSLSPYTGLAEQVLVLLDALQQSGHITEADGTDFLGGLLRRLARHLTAYDLVTFHHRGANYPDALVLDSLLRGYIARVERRPDLFTDHAEGTEAERRLRRRALRQAWLLRRWYEGLSVPEAPTSQGEALRVLPEAYPRIPEEQILQPGRRPRRLFADDPLDSLLRGNVAELLRQAVADLRQPEELRELGTALFLDRPLGAGKAPGEPDATPLLSYEAFSPSLAERRLGFLAEKLSLLSAEELAAHRQRLRGLDVTGLPLDGIPTASRPGVVSLAEARQVAPDFLLLRTTAPSARALLDLYDFVPLVARTALDWLRPGRFLVLGLGPTKEGVIVTVYDAALRPRLELAYDPAAGYRSRAGIEYPASGLRVLAVR